MTTIFLHGAGVIPDTTRPQEYPLLDRALRLCPDLIAPVMPDALDPTPESWLRGMDAALSDLPGDAVIIGHSLGASVFLKWLAERRPGFRARCFLACAMPFWGPGGWEYDGFRLPPDFGTATGGLARMILCRADDDDVVAADHLDLYSRALPRAEIIRVAKGGHDLDTDEILPLLRAALGPPG